VTVTHTPPSDDFCARLRAILVDPDRRVLDPTPRFRTVSIIAYGKEDRAMRI
jgi:hypothetical protein